jgi:hypothetical protein
VQLVPGAGTPLVQDGRPVPGPQHDVGVVGRHERVEGGRLVRRDQQERVAGREGREIGHEGVDVVGRGEHDQPAFRPQAAGDVVDALGQLPVAQDALARENGGAVPVTGEIGGERDPDEVRWGGHLHQGRENL